jgi:Holliday junction resolvasome RuvABC endonuclease subunit
VPEAHAGKSREDLIQELEDQRRLAADNLTRLRTMVAERVAIVTKARDEAEEKLKELDDELTTLVRVIEEGALEVEMAFETPADTSNLVADGAEDL